jgi:hypothetical protein
MLQRRFQLESPLQLARRIQDAIDEDGLSEYHRREDDQAAEMEELLKMCLVEKPAKKTSKRCRNVFDLNRI